MKNRKRHRQRFWSHCIYRPLCRVSRPRRGRVEGSKNSREQASTDAAKTENARPRAGRVGTQRALMHMHVSIHLPMLHGRPMFFPSTLSCLSGSCFPLRAPLVGASGCNAFGQQCSRPSVCLLLPVHTRLELRRTARTWSAGTRYETGGYTTWD